MTKKDYVNILLVVLIILLSINILISTLAGKEFSKKLDVKIEASKPALISITKITADCSDCSSIDLSIQNLKSGNVNITDEKEFNFKTSEAKELISRYNIKTLPTFIVTSENLSKLSTVSYEKVNDALVFNNIKPPYYDIKQNKIIGLVKVTLLKADNCEKCTDISFIKTQLEKVGVKITEYNELSQNEAKELISKYNIENLPNLIVSNDLSVYEISKAWSTLGEVTDDGSFIITKLQPPYYSLKDKTIKGLISLKTVFDISCTECQDKSLQETALKSIGLFFDNKKEVDSNSNEGRDLIKKYAITKLPATILSKETADYSGIGSIWAQVGTVETDGSFILRNADLLGNYKDLKTGEVVKKAAEE